MCGARFSSSTGCSRWRHETSIPKRLPSPLSKLQHFRLNYFALNEMYDRGIRKITTHQSASNFAILNLEIGFFDFRIVRGFAVLRKLYGDAPSRND